MSEIASWNNLAARVFAVSIPPPPLLSVLVLVPVYLTCLGTVPFSGAFPSGIGLEFVNFGGAALSDSASC